MIEFSEMKRGDVVYITILDDERGTHEVAELVFKDLVIKLGSNQPDAMVSCIATSVVFTLSDPDSLYRTRVAAELAAVASILRSGPDLLGGDR